MSKKTPPLERVPRHPGIYRRGSRYVVTFRDLNGHQRKRFARTLREARDLKAALRTDVRRREYRQESRVTFVDYARDWIDTYQGRTSSGVRDATREDYRARLGLRLDEHGQLRLDDQGRAYGAVGFFGRRRLAEIEPRDIKAYAKQLADRGLAPNTVRLALAPVKALFATAFEEGLIRVNPAANVRIIQPAATDADTDPHVKALTESELQALLEEIRCPRCSTADTPPTLCEACERWRLFFSFLAHTGLRIGEAIALRWDDVDLGGRRVQVRRRFYRGSFAPPKSRYGRRAVPLSPRMAQALWRLRGTAGDDELVFASETGGVLDSSNLMRRVLKPAARRAGVAWVGFHTFRHTCATTLFRRGLNPKQAQVWLGHHSPAFTLATYVHLIADDLPDASFLDKAPAAEPVAAAREEDVIDALETAVAEARGALAAAVAADV